MATPSILRIERLNYALGGVVIIVAALTHNERASIISLVLLFVVGGALLCFVKETRA